MRDERGGDSCPFIMVKDDVSKGFVAHVVTIKGSVDWVAAKICEDVK